MDSITKQIFENLFDRLVSVFRNKDFIKGVFATATTNEDRQAIIDFIDRGEDVTPSTVLSFALLLDDAREKPKP